MSSKYSVAQGDDFQLYSDVNDEGHVFLRVDNTFFEASPRGVTVRLPLHVWEYLRAFPGADLTAAHLSDEQIEQEAIDAVEARLARAAECPDEEGSLFGVGAKFIMGESDLPRERQIAKYVEHRRRQREHHRSVLAQVQALSGKQSG